MAVHRVEAEVTGSVWKIVVRVGDTVSSGDVLIILESMKMEIPVESPVSGRIAELLVGPEEAVEEGQVLVVIA
jgi:acetyl-CoA carboxylase biotin carboxyl carrier protein